MLNIRTRARVASVAVAAALAAVSAPAISGNTLTYKIRSMQNVSQGVAFVKQAGSDAKLYFANQTLPATYPFRIPFAFDTKKAENVEHTLLFGVFNDVDNVSHLVLGTSVPFADFAVGKQFDDLFAHDEASLIDDLADLAAGSGDAYDSAYADLLSFSKSVTGPDVDIGFKPGQDFDLLAFSAGKIIGDGTVTESAPPPPPPPTPAVPEPASWALMIGGFAFAGGAMRHRRSVRVRFA